MLCKLLGISKSSYYRYQRNPKGKRTVENEHLVFQIRVIHRESQGIYGLGKILVTLKQRGIHVGKNRVARLMQCAGIRSKRARKFKATTDSNHSLPIAENLLNRAFQIGPPNQVWLSDITYLRTREGWAYCCAVMDLGSRKIVGWSVLPRMTRRLVIKALEMAVKRQNPGRGLMFHSDRGSQYASHEFRQKLEERGFTQSMSGKGDCWDNSPMESFFASLKTEWMNWKPSETREEARLQVVNYIEGFYNSVRIHHSLGGMPPNEYETAMLRSAA